MTRLRNCLVYRVVHLVEDNLFLTLKLELHFSIRSSYWGGIFHSREFMCFVSSLCYRKDKQNLVTPCLRLFTSDGPLYASNSLFISLTQGEYDGADQRQPREGVEPHRLWKRWISLLRGSHRKEATSQVREERIPSCEKIGCQISPHLLLFDRRELAMQSCSETVSTPWGAKSNYQPIPHFIRRNPLFKAPLGWRQTMRGEE